MEGKAENSTIVLGPMRAHVRFMIRRDMSEVLAIENQSFEFPWSQCDFTRCLQQRNCIGMVAEARVLLPDPHILSPNGVYGDRVLGYMLYELHKSRLHLLNLAVVPEYVGRKIGAQMVLRLIDKLSPSRRVRIVTEVRERNLAAQLFFQAIGFRAFKVLRDYYDDTSEDAYAMEYHYECAHVRAWQQMVADGVPVRKSRVLAIG